MRIAIYDLDRTLTRKPTFTAFLVHAALHLAPWRLLLFPLWVLAMLGYRAGLYSRTALKRFGMKLMVGNACADQLAAIGDAFAQRRIRHPGLMPGTMQLLEEDRASGARLVMATAAFEFYAQGFARQLGFDAVIATRWDGSTIPGGNCYGKVKCQRVLRWLEEHGLARKDTTIRFVSDSFADAPLLAQVDEPVFVTASRKQAAKAADKGWAVIHPLAT